MGKGEGMGEAYGSDEEIVFQFPLEVVSFDVVGEGGGDFSSHVLSESHMLHRNHILNPPELFPSSLFSRKRRSDLGMVNGTGILRTWDIPPL